MSDERKKRKIRIELRKNRDKLARERDWTRQYLEGEVEETEGTVRAERVKAKGELSRRRTIVAEVAEEKGDLPVLPAVDLSHCLPGRVLRVQGLYSTVLTDDGRTFRCVVRKLLRAQLQY